MAEAKAELVGRVLDPDIPEDLVVLRSLPDRTVLVQVDGYYQAAQIGQEAAEFYDPDDPDDSPYLYHYLYWAGSDIMTDLQPGRWNPETELTHPLRVVWVPEAAE